MSFPQNTNPLLTGFEVVQSAISKYKDEIQKYYFDVLLNRYRCPRCNNRFNLIAPSKVSCTCGHSFDPTVEFQRCPDCNGRLARKTYHYACVSCSKIVASKFLFDERVFDNEYFQEKMRMYRKRREREKAKLINFLQASRSETLILSQPMDINCMPSFEDDLNKLIGVNQDIDEYKFERAEFVFSDYRSHLLRLLNDEILFDSIEPLDSDERKDKIFRFIALIFMEQDREIWLSQQNDGILVRKHEAFREG